MHELDKALIASCPTILVPRYGDLLPIDHNTHRLLVATDGLWLEVHRPWLEFVWPIATVDRVAIPYGMLSPKMTFTFGKIPKSLVERFISEARSRLPHEHAAWIIWNGRDNRLEYLNLDIISDSEERITYVRPALDEDSQLCVDLHSHGVSPAYFSDQDNFDDRGECKISAVFGHLDDDPTWTARLCVRGLFIELYKQSRWSRSYA